MVLLSLCVCAGFYVPFVFVFSFKNHSLSATEFKHTPLESLSMFIAASALYFGRSVELN